MNVGGFKVTGKFSVSLEHLLTSSDYRVKDTLERQKELKAQRGEETLGCISGRLEYR